MMDKAKRKYYNKKTRPMYGGSDSDYDDGRVRNDKEGFVEVKSQVVELGRLHKREEELYFYDAFAYPWEKDKHYKMVYQLEKKYFPDHCFDKAFLLPGEKSSKRSVVEKKDEEKDNKGVEEKKVGEFFKCLKKVPNGDSGVVMGAAAAAEPFVSTRSGGLPSKSCSPVIQRESWEHIKDEDLKKTAASFCGEIWQVPPMFSAIKVGGEKMYDKARRGESIELSPRRISIFQFDVERSLDDRQNVIFRVTCSKGTYVRSLCADFAKTLKSCAHLTALRRDSIGQYSADDAWEFKDLEEAITKGYM